MCHPDGSSQVPLPPYKQGTPEFALNGFTVLSGIVPPALQLKIKTTLPRSCIKESVNT